MRLRPMFFAAVAIALSVPAFAATSAPYAKGGRTKDFAVDVEKYRQSGEQFRITGHCQSACTMFLAARKVCVEPGATLLFHAGNNATATKRMLDSYKPALRNYLVANKIMETKAFTSVPGSTIISRFGYPRC